MEQNKITLKEFVLANDKTYLNLFWISTYAVIMAIAAQIEIPIYPVPFTLQTFFVFLAGAILGKVRGSVSMGMYLLLGIVGLPVFSGGTAGLWKILGPTGGYLLAFPISAFVVGGLVNIRREYWWILISMVIGSLVIFTFGTIQLHFVYLHDWVKSFQAGFLIFTIWDIVKIIAAASIAHYYLKNVKAEKA